MTYSCPYCGQSLLEDEIVCWQCGRQVQATLSEIENPKPETGPGQGSTERTQTVSPLAIYVTLTLLVIVGVMLTTVYLGRQPRLRAGTDTELPEGWQWVNENSNDFVLFLPESWSFLDPESEGGEADLRASFQARTRWQWITEPLGTLDEELTVLFLAQGPAPPDATAGTEAIVLVARSTLLNRLAPAEMVSLAEELVQETDLALAGSERIALLPGIEEEHVSLILEAPGEGGSEPLRCHQKLIPGALHTLLISACTESEPRSQATVNRIIESFQRLGP